MSVFVEGLVGIIVFYVLILVVGLYAGRKTKDNNTAEEAILANRKFGIFVSSMTLTAAWYGGGYISGTAEVVANPYLGVAGVVAPWSYGVSLTIGSFMFAKAIRARNYITFVDALEQRYGLLMGVIVLLISVLGSILYIASILLSLGATVSVVLDIGLIPSTIASVTIVVLYTFFGGLKSVAYTDIVQLPCIVIGLVLAIPFAVSHPAVSDVVENSNRWTGKWEEKQTAVWIDSFVILILGAIPVDVFLQRLLSAKTTKIANISSVISTCGVLALSLPPIFIGAIGANTDWSLTSYARQLGNATNGTQVSPPYSMTLPMVLQYLTPTWVAVISLGSVSAAVMSSMDSALIAVGSEMACNLYKPLLRPKAGGREIVWVIRVVVVLTAAISTVIALTADSIYSLFYLIGDFGGVILFPQFLCAVYLPSTNTYGSFFGFVAGVVLRIGGGDYFLNIPPFIKYPFYSDILGQLFPFKSFAALCTFLVIVFISYVAKFLFAEGRLPKWMDVFRCFKSSYNLDPKNVEVSMDAKYNVKKQNAEVDYRANLGFQK